MERTEVPRSAHLARELFDKLSIARFHVSNEIKPNLNEYDRAMERCVEIRDELEAIANGAP